MLLFRKGQIFRVLASKEVKLVDELKEKYNDQETFRQLSESIEKEVEKCRRYLSRESDSNRRPAHYE